MELLRKGGAWERQSIGGSGKERFQRLWQGSRWAKAGIECRTQERLIELQNLASQQKAAPAGD